MPDTLRGGGAGRGAPAGDGGSARSIGAVLRALREEFPGVTVSKIRFLESEGLVEPERSPSGYRKFRDEDVERLVYVLRMQRDRFLPLKVIRECLDAAGGPVRPGEAPGFPGGPSAPQDAAEPPEYGPQPPQARVGRAELLAAVGADEQQLAEWESYGLIGPDGDGRYGTGQAGIARMLADLRRYGLEPRHLRAVRAAADREAALIEQVVAPRIRHRDARTRAGGERTARELAALSARLHAALVESALGLRSR